MNPPHPAASTAPAGGLGDLYDLPPERPRAPEGRQRFSGLALSRWPRAPNRPTLRFVARVPATCRAKPANAAAGPILTFCLRTNDRLWATSPETLDVSPRAPTHGTPDECSEGLTELFASSDVPLTAGVHSGCHTQHPAPCTAARKPYAQAHPQQQTRHRTRRPARFGVGARGVTHDCEGRFRARAGYGACDPPSRLAPAEEATLRDCPRHPLAADPSALREHGSAQATPTQRSTTPARARAAGTCAASMRHD